MKIVLLWLVCVIVRVGTGAAQTSDTAEHYVQKKVLVIHSSRIDAPYTVLVENTLRTTIGAGLAGHMDYYTEHIDFARFSGAAYQGALRDFLRRKYAGQHLDVVVAESDAPFEFVVQHRAEMFPGVPLVFSIEQRAISPIPNSTGVVFPVDMKSTLELALRLQPDVTRVFVISGASEIDRFYEDIARRQFREYEGRVAFTYLPLMPLQDLLQEVTRLPQHSIIYFVSLFEDGAGNKFIPMDILNKLSAPASAPIYCWPEMTLDHGVVGGHLLSEEVVARHTGELALRVLRGENPGSIPVAEIRPYVNVFDWRQLRRWRISEDRLPAGSVIRFREASFWSRYRWRIVGVVSLFAAQALLIVGLLVNIARRGRAEKAVRESHGRIEYLAGRLIIAQEEERKYVARELHDDLSQQAAALSIDLTNLRRQLPEASDSTLGLVTTLQESATRISDRIHHLSHDLHSLTLEHVGLAPTLKAYCNEFSDREGIAVSLRIQEGPGRVPDDAALCLFRVTQEALRNVAKHSGSKSVEVTLFGSSEAIELRVVDHGCGLDRQTGPGRGLGLASMEERIKLLRGSLDLKGRPGVGTVLTARLPLGVRVHDVVERPETQLV